MRIDEIGILMDNSLRKGDPLHLSSWIDPDTEHGNDRRGIELIHQMEGLFNRLFTFAWSSEEEIVAVIDHPF